MEEVARWRKRAGQSDFLIGASCHSLEAARQAGAAGADYVFFGPVFATPSKQAFGAPQGVRELERVCQAVVGGATIVSVTCLELVRSSPLLISNEYWFGTPTAADDL